MTKFVAAENKIKRIMAKFALGMPTEQPLFIEECILKGSNLNCVFISLVKLSEPNKYSKGLKLLYPDKICPKKGTPKTRPDYIIQFK